MRKKLILSLLFLLFISLISCRAQIASDEKRHAGTAKAGSICPAAGMTASRAGHTATVLADGRVLIAGGFAGRSEQLASAEIFDPKSGTFSPVGNMSTARAGHTATLLPDGRVLIAGGYNGSYLDSAEIFDPAQRGFAPAAGRMTAARSEHRAVLLAGGKILLAGGVGTGWTFLASAELFDPQSGTFSSTGDMTMPRESHTATLLESGRVLITGGHRGRRSAMTIYATTEIYDPSTGTFSPGPRLTIRRHKHDAARLADGRVLIVGGSDERDGGGAYTSVEIFDPATGAFARIGDMNESRYKLQGTTVLLGDGRVLIAGGAARAEIFDPKTGKFAPAPGSFESIRLFAAAAPLPGGEVLIAGGYDHSVTATSKAWIYRP